RVAVVGDAGARGVRDGQVEPGPPARAQRVLRHRERVGGGFLGAPAGVADGHARALGRSTARRRSSVRTAGRVTMAVVRQQTSPRTASRPKRYRARFWAIKRDE